MCGKCKLCAENRGKRRFAEKYSTYSAENSRFAPQESGRIRRCFQRIRQFPQNAPATNIRPLSLDGWSGKKRRFKSTTFLPWKANKIRKTVGFSMVLRPLQRCWLPFWLLGRRSQHTFDPSDGVFFLFFREMCIYPHYHRLILMPHPARGSFNVNIRIIEHRRKSMSAIVLPDCHSSPRNFC